MNGSVGEGAGHKPEYISLSPGLHVVEEWN